MSRHRCLCTCHDGSVADRRRSDGVDVNDPVEAVIACERCLAAHIGVLLDPEIPRDRAMLPPSPPKPTAPLGEWKDSDGDNLKNGPYAGEDGG